MLQHLRTAALVPFSVLPSLVAPGCAFDRDPSPSTQRAALEIESAAPLATYVDCTQHSMALASVFEIRATVAEDHTNAEVFDAIEATLTRVAGDIAPVELRPAQRGWYNAKLFRLESSLGRASQLAWALSVAPAPPTFDGQLGVYEAITPAAVLDAVRRYLRGRPRVVTLIEKDSTQPWFGVLRVRTEGAP